MSQRDSWPETDPWRTYRSPSRATPERATDASTPGSSFDAGSPGGAATWFSSPHRRRRVRHRLVLTHDLLEALAVLNGACELGDVDLVREMLADQQPHSHPHPQAVGDMDELNEASLAELIVDARAMVEARESFGLDHPLFYAASAGQAEITRMLIEFVRSQALGGRARRAFADALGRALHSCCVEGHADVVAVLLDDGQASQDSLTWLATGDGPSAGLVGWSALATAARYGQAGVVSLLLARRLAFAADEDAGSEAIECSCCSDDGGGDDGESVDAALGNSCERTTHASAAEGRLAWPLVEAARFGHVAVVALLWQAGFGVYDSPPGAETPLFAAAAAGRSQVVSFLLGLDTFDLEHECGPRGRTPLMAACEAGSLRVVELLVRAGASVRHASSVDGKTARALATDANAHVVADYLEDCMGGRDVIAVGGGASGGGFGGGAAAQVAATAVAAATAAASTATTMTKALEGEALRVGGLLRVDVGTHTGRRVLWLGLIAAGLWLAYARGWLRRSR